MGKRWRVTVPVYVFVTFTAAGDDEDEAIDSGSKEALDSIYKGADGSISAPRGVSLGWGGAEQADWDKADVEELAGAVPVDGEG